MCRTLSDIHHSHDDFMKFNTLTPKVERHGGGANGTVLVMTVQEEAHAAGGPACTSDYSIYGKALSDGSSAVMILNREQTNHPAGIMMLPEIARTMNGVATMKPLAMRTIMKKGMSAPIFEAPSGSPSARRPLPVN